MNKIKLWAFISIMISFSLIFAVCEVENGPSTPPEEPEEPFEWPVFEDIDAEGGVPYHITNNFAQDSSSAFLVQWHNDTNVAKQALQIVTRNGNAEDIRTIIAEGITWNPTKTPTDVGPYESRNIFKIEITDLNPNTRYVYRIGSPEGWSQDFFHLTSSGTNANFSFTVAADSQDNVFNQMRSTFRAANEFDANNRFFLIAGDISDYPQENTSEFPNYTKVANDFNIRTPIAVTQGNHDTYLVNTSNRDGYVFGSAEVFNSFVTFPENGWNQGAHHGPHRSKSYYFYYNKVLIIMLNTFATQNATGPAEPVHTAQAAWLREILQHDKDNQLSKYIIVVTHIPFFAGRGSSNNNEPWLMAPTRAAYGKILSDFDVDICFFGHDHVYTRSEPIKITGTTTGNTRLQDMDFFDTPNGTIYSIAGSIGPKIYAFRNHPSNPNAPPVPTDSNTYIPQSWPVRTDQQSPGMFVNVKVTSQKLIVTARRVGVTQPLDTYEVMAKR